MMCLSIKALPLHLYLFRFVIEKVKKIIRWKELTDYICKKWDALIKKVSFA